MPTIRTAANRTLAAAVAIGGVKQGEYAPYQSVLLSVRQPTW